MLILGKIHNLQFENQNVENYQNHVPRKGCPEKWFLGVCREIHTVNRNVLITTQYN